MLDLPLLSILSPPCHTLTPTGPVLQTHSETPPRLDAGTGFQPPDGDMLQETLAIHIRPVMGEHVGAILGPRYFHNLQISRRFPLLGPELADGQVFNSASALARAQALGGRRVCPELQVRRVPALVGHVFDPEAFDAALRERIDLRLAGGQRNTLLGPRPKQKQIIGMKYQSTGGTAPRPDAAPPIRVRVHHNLVGLRLPLVLQ